MPPEPSAPLDAFFEAMSELLAGRLAAGEVERLLGKSPSGTARLDRYRIFVHRQRRAVLDGFHASARAAAELAAAGAWARLADAYIREHPPRQWNPSRYAAGMAPFLSERLGGTDDSRRAVVELADYAVTRWSAMVADADENPTAPMMERTVFVRAYTHDVVTFSREQQELGATLETPPSIVQTTVVIGRSWKTETVVVTRPSLAALVALARRDEPGTPLPSAALTERDIENAEDELVALGMLRPRTP